MRVVNALLFAVAVLLVASALVSAVKPKHLLRSLYYEQTGDAKKASEMANIPNNWNFLKPTPVGHGVNGAGGCAGCTLIVGLMEQVLQLNNNDTQLPINALCGPMHKIERDICTDALKLLLPVIQTYRDEGLTADVACHSLKACTTDPGQPTCHLFPTKPNARRVNEIVASIEGAAFRQRHEPLFKDIRSFNICTLLPEVCQMEDHLPAFDLDGDTFASADDKTLRGSDWRGIDCNTLDKTVHPGRDSLDATTDDNCNGIFGTDPSGAPWEEKFCQGSEQMGIAIIGDSATAHFSIPPYALEARYFNYTTFRELPRDIENELDWPMLSWSTAHANNSNYPSYWQQIEPTNSIYKYLRENNLCNNNDYQNLGVNGARSSKNLDFAKILGRVNSARSGGVKNKPLMLFQAQIGNDLCNSNYRVSSMTTPEEFYANYLKAVLYADSVLAPGSIQVLVGLADGRILYEYMHARIHPIGTTNQDVTYTDLYDYLNCLQISPCAGWMNSNATIRNDTSAHGALLSDQLLKLKKDTEGQLKNSKVHVIINWTDALKQETKYPHWMLIEPSDGFHPSGLGNSLLAEYMLNQTKIQGFWPKPNPMNDQIRAQFPNI